MKRYDTEVLVCCNKSGSTGQTKMNVTAETETAARRKVLEACWLAKYHVLRFNYIQERGLNNHDT